MRDWTERRPARNPSYTEEDEPKVSFPEALYVGQDYVEANPPPVPAEHLDQREIVKHVSAALQGIDASGGETGYGKPVSVQDIENNFAAVVDNLREVYFHNRQRSENPKREAEPFSQYAPRLHDYLAKVRTSVVNDLGRQREGIPFENGLGY